jgi:LysM repeat protein
MSEDNRATSSGEWTKFGILVIVMIGAVLVVSSSRTFLFEHIVPIVMGDQESPAPSPVEVAPPVLEAPGPAYPVEPLIELSYPVEPLAEPAYPVEPANIEPEVEEVVSPASDDTTTVIESEAPSPYPGPETTVIESEPEPVQGEEGVPSILGNATFGTAAVSGGEPTVYVVKTGDTIVGIAEQHNVTVSDLVAANGLANPNRIKIGDSLTIPVP